MQGVTHRQISVKVNVRVDEGISGVIGILSRIPRLRTSSSCQGRTGHWLINLKYGQTVPETLVFFRKLAKLHIPELEVKAIPYADQVFIKMTGSNADMELVENVFNRFVATQVRPG